MPELPEVETVRRGLEPVVAGRRLERVEILDSRLVRPFEPLEVGAELEGEQVESLDRRGKYLIFRFESGRVLLVHLRMTGSFVYAPAGSLPDDPHRRAVLTLDNEADVAYRDVRRFGTWLVLEPGELDPYLAERLGDEPFSEAFTPRVLAERLRGRRAPVKAVLLDQRSLAGMGNIYADEALWRARVHPLRPAGDLTTAEVKRVHAGIRAALELGIARQGATLSDYRTADGERGGMQEEFEAYGREGEPCSRCGRPISKIRAAGRGTWFCSRCQPDSPRRSRPASHLASAAQRRR
jgi:formamidopyrimidine-DNA glycosylase